MFAEGLPNEVLIRTREDEDFGALELWQWHHDSPPLLDWRGRVRVQSAVEIPLSIPIDHTDVEAVFGFIDSTARQTFRWLSTHAADVRLEVAKYEIEHAEDWAFQSGRAPPTLESFAASLQISRFVVSANSEKLGFEVWLNETTTDIFTGHSILATFDKRGALLSAGL